MDYTKVLEFLRGAKGVAVYALLNSWYWLIAGAALTVTYNVLGGMEGPIGHIYDDLKVVLENVIRLSVKCPAQITNFESFFRCLGT
jgi:hypothetical protein